MNKTFTIQIENVDIREVRLVRSDEEANYLLSNGWIFLNSGVSHTDSAGYQAKTHYMLGRPDKKKEK